MEQMKQKEWSKLYAATRITTLPAHSTDAEREQYFAEV